MTRCTESNQVTWLIVCLVFVVVMHHQSMGPVVSASADTASSAVSLSDSGLERLSECGSVRSDRSPVFPCWGIPSAEVSASALMVAKDLPDDHGWRSNDRLSAMVAGVHLLKPWLAGNLTGMLLLIGSLTCKSTERSAVQFGLGCPPGKVLSAFGAGKQLAASSSFRLSACMATAGRRPVLQLPRLNFKRLLAVGAVDGDGGQSDPARVGVALITTESTCIPGLTLEGFTALGAVGHSSIFPCWPASASTSGSTG